MAEIDWTKYATPEEPEEQKREDEIDWSAYVKPTAQPKQDDTAIRDWLKSTYTGPQKVDDIPITPQLVERFERQNQPEAPAPQMSQREMAEAMTPLGQLGRGLNNVLQGGTQAGARLADLAVKAYSANPMLAPDRGMGVMVGANKDEVQKTLGQVIAGSTELEKERGLDGTAGEIMHQIGAMGVDIPVKYSNPAGMGIMAAEGFAEGGGVSAQDYANQIESGGGNLTIEDKKTILDALKAGAISTANAAALMGLGKVATALPQGIARPAVESAGMAAISAAQGGDPVAGGVLGFGFGAKKINAPQKPLFKSKAPGPRVIGHGEGSNVPRPPVSTGESVKKDGSGGISEPVSGPKEYVVVGDKKQHKIKIVSEEPQIGVKDPMLGDGPVIETRKIDGVSVRELSGNGYTTIKGISNITSPRIKGEATDFMVGEIRTEHAKGNAVLSDSFITSKQAYEMHDRVRRDHPEFDFRVVDKNDGGDVRVGIFRVGDTRAMKYEAWKGFGEKPPTPPTMNKLPTPEAPKAVDMAAPKPGATVTEGVPVAEPVAPKPSGMIGEKIKTVLNRMPVAFKNAKKAYLDWVNKAQDIDNLSRFAKDNNIKLDETLDPLLTTRRKWGAVGTANSIIMDGTFKRQRGNIIRTGEGFQSIIKDFDGRSTIKDKKLRMARLDEFLQANRTITDLAATEKATPKQVEAAQRKLNALEMSNPAEYKNLSETANRLYDYQRRTLNMLVESGIMSQESYDNILAKNKAYVPFERILPDIMDGLTVSGKLRSAPRKVIFGMKGSEKEVKNTIESVLKKTYEIVDAAETNYVNRSVAQFADALPELIKKQKYYPGRRPGKNEIVVYEDGKPSVYSVSDGIFQGMKGLNPQSSNIFMKMLTAPKKMLQVGATATPEFAIRNLMRDQTGAMINTRVKFRPFVDTISSIADIMGRKDIFKEYMASGAGMQSYADLNRSALTKTLEHIRGNKTKLERMNIITYLGDLSSLLETATRLGTYKAARRSGATVSKAAYVSRESTLDFSRSGTTGEKVNKVIAFFNAGIQGTDRMARVAKADPVGFTAKAIASVTIPEILFQLINKDDEEFTNAPRWRKDLFWHIPGLNAWIPKPFVVGQAFGSVPGRFMEYAITKDPHSFDGILNTVSEGFSPVGIDAIGGIIPTAIKPLLENMFNYNFFTQTNLFPEYKEKLDPSERSSKFTKETFKMLGEALGMSPAKMENLFRGYTAGLGQYAVQASDALINSFKEDAGRPPTEPSNIPVVKGFVGRRTSSSPEKLNQFYRAYEDVDTAYTRHKKLKESGKPGEAGKYRDEHPEIKYRPDFNRYRKIMSDYGKRIDKINAMKIPDWEKRKQLIEVEKKRLVSLDKILKLYSGEVSLIEVPKTLRGILQ